MLIVNYMRMIKLKHDKLHGIFNNRKIIQDEISEKYAEFQRVEKELGKLGLKLQKEKEKVIPINEKIMKDYELTEFEYVSKVDAKDGEIIIEIRDQVEDFIEAQRNKKLETPE